MSLDSNPPVFLSENLRCLRKRLNISQEELAKRVGLNRGNIASYEKGTAQPKICNLLKFAQVFGVSVLDLTGKNLTVENGMEGGPLNGAEKTISFSLEEKQRLELLVAQMTDLERVVESIYNCHCFNRRAVDHPSKEFQTANTHLEQLHEVTHELLQMQRKTLEFIQQKFE